MGKQRYRKEVMEAIKKAEALGFTVIEEKVKRGARHVKMRHTNGGMIVFPATPSSPSWAKNQEADAKRVAKFGSRPRNGS